MQEDVAETSNSLRGFSTWQDCNTVLNSVKWRSFLNDMIRTCVLDFVYYISSVKLAWEVIHQAQSEYKHSLTFRVRVCCHSNKARAPIANPPNSAQIQGTPYPSPKYLRPCSSVAMRPRTDTHTQTRVTNIHFASSTLTQNVMMPNDFRMYCGDEHWIIDRIHCNCYWSTSEKMWPRHDYDMNMILS